MSATTAETWVNLLTPGATASHSKRCRTKKAPLRILGKEVGWFWVDPEQSRNAGGTTVQDARSVTPVGSFENLSQPMTGPPSEDDWQQITGDELASGDDLSDLDDPELVALDSRKPSPKPVLQFNHSDPSTYQPLRATSPDVYTKAPLPLAITRSEQLEPLSHQEQCIRQRIVSTGDDLPTQENHTPSAVVPVAQCWDSQFEGSADLVWTFVAGIILYFVSV